MKILTYLCMFMGGIFCTPFISYAADCNSLTSSTTVNFNDVTLSPDVAVGQSITGDVSFKNINFASCESTNTWSKTFTGSIQSNSSSIGTYNGRQTFATNIPGVGLQIGADMPITSNKGHNYSYSGWIKSGNSATIFSLSDIGWGEVFTIGLTPKLNLIKTSSQVTSGTLSGIAGYAKASGNQGSASTTINLGGNVVTSGCTLSGGQNINIKLEDINKEDLPSVGSVWGESEQNNISLKCNAGTAVYITFNGTVASGTSGTNILQNNGTAQGVGVQLIDLHNGQNHPIDMGYRWNPVTIGGSDTQALIPIAARYIRIGDLKPGTVDASATYVLDYD